MLTAPTHCIYAVEDKHEDSLSKIDRVHNFTAKVQLKLISEHDAFVQPDKLLQQIPAMNAVTTEIGQLPFKCMAIDYIRHSSYYFLSLLFVTLPIPSFGLDKLTQSVCF